MTPTTNDDSCTLGEGEWTFSAFQKEASMARFIHADTFTITVDTTNPVIVTTIDPDPTTMPAATMRTDNGYGHRRQPGPSGVCDQA